MINKYREVLYIISVAWLCIFTGEFLELEVDVKDKRLFGYEPRAFCVHMLSVFVMLGTLEPIRRNVSCPRHGSVGDGSYTNSTFQEMGFSHVWSKHASLGSRFFR